MIMAPCDVIDRQVRVINERKRQSAISGQDWASASACTRCRTYSIEIKPGEVVEPHRWNPRRAGKSTLMEDLSAHLFNRAENFVAGSETHIE